jgi:peptidoglycan L-alanyl-D-glutamate endopeptidase CwlK
MYHGLSVSPYDITIIHGWRGEEVQNALFASGASTKEWPFSKHNTTDDEDDALSQAFDFGPYFLLPSGKMGIPWSETHIFAVIAGCFFAAAAELEVKLRWGGDWDADGDTKEHKLQDWGHMEEII